MFAFSSSARKCVEPPILWTKVSSVSIAPLVLNDVKTFVNRPLEDVFWDAETTTLIIVAQRAIEQHCQIAIAPTVWSGTAPMFPVKLLRRPFLAVTALNYVDPDTGTITAVDPTTYLATPDRQMMGLLLPGSGTDYPTPAVRPDAVQLTVTTGWPVDGLGNPIIPEDIVHALKMTVAAIDMNRGDVHVSGGHLEQTVYGQTHSGSSSIIPSPALALLGPYTYRGVYAT